MSFLLFLLLVDVFKKNILLDFTIFNVLTALIWSPFPQKHKTNVDVKVNQI